MHVDVGIVRRQIKAGAHARMLTRCKPMLYSAYAFSE